MLGAATQSTPVRLGGGVAMLIFATCAFILVFFENGRGAALGVEHDELGVKATTAVLVQTTKLFWPFSSSPSKKAAAIGVKASKSHSLQPHASLSAESDERINNSKLESKAIREAQEVMRELVLKDRQAAHKAAEENYLKNLVAEHVKEAKAAAQTKIAAAKAAILRAKLAAEAKVSMAKAAAKREQEQNLLRMQLCSHVTHKKAVTREQCDAAIKRSQAETERKSRAERELQQESVVLQKQEEESNLRVLLASRSALCEHPHHAFLQLQRRIEEMARGLRRVDSESDDEAVGKGRP